MFTFIITEEDNLERLDKFLADKLREQLISRKKIKKTKLAGNVLVDDQVVTMPRFNLASAKIISFKELAKQETKISPTEIELDVIYEDDDLMVVNKQAGLTVHPGAGNSNNTLVNALLARKTDLSSVSGSERPGIVHRLDKNTSGLMVVAKNDQAHLHISRQLEERSLTRKYYALIWGMLNPEEGIIETYIARSSRNRKLMEVTVNKGKKAITRYQSKKIMLNGAVTLIECQLQTGRTHQIRVHMSNMGHSILGDPEYGNNKKKLLRHFNLEDDKLLFNFKRQALHAFYLQLEHPISGKLLEFQLDMPKDMQDIISYIEQK